MNMKIVEEIVRKIVPYVAQISQGRTVHREIAFTVPINLDYKILKRLAEALGTDDISLDRSYYSDVDPFSDYTPTGGTHLEVYVRNIASLHTIEVPSDD